MKTVHPDVHGSIRHPTVARIHPGSDMHHKMSDVFSFNNFLLTQKKKKSGLSYGTIRANKDRGDIFRQGITPPIPFKWLMWGLQSTKGFPPCHSSWTQVSEINSLLKTP
jgi:hypothetical protein